MKTFSYYLKEAVIVIAFALFMSWLLSACANRKQRVIDLIHAYGDSIGMNKTRIAALSFPIDSLRDAHEKEFPPQRYFPGQEQPKEEYVNREYAAYRKLLKDIEHYELSIMTKRLLLEYKNARFKEMIDSLKIELYR